MKFAFVRQSVVDNLE